MTTISTKIKNCDLPKMQPVSDVKRRLIARVMQQTDDLVIVIEYEGKDGAVTRRVVSPIRFVGEDRFLALCLSREEPRQFYIDRCRSVRVDLAATYIMPVEMMTLAS
jgi:predicted DNA-binding transcriptional regulator YafY